MDAAADNPRSGSGSEKTRHSVGNMHFESAVNGCSSGPRTPEGGDWELDCEICHKHGVNRVCVLVSSRDYLY